jgi:hypothetical protein
LLELSIKDFDEGFEIDLNALKTSTTSRNNDNDGVRSDIIYAENVLDKFLDKCFTIDKGISIMYDEDTGLWSLDETTHRKSV